ncbi:MAG: formate--tetrahydrofolate ligase [Candidatus Omnitrophica bacterium]|nr:formate--tetrahydrofolate ligase [Candidatus Omnitrophota bacterium]
MKSDIEIARSIQLRPIVDVAADVGLTEDEIDYYGRNKAKIHLNVLDRLSERPEGKLILVTGMTPTPAGEGKTVTSIGLSQALCKLGKKSIVCIREPSLGPVFGIKGGAAGGGFAQVLPMDEINLHFTGDIHAVTSAHNLLSAIIDNHINHGNELNIDRSRVMWPRVMDIADRQLRTVVVGLGGRANGFPQETGFIITVASEIMAILALSENLKDLRTRLSNILVAYNKERKPVFARDLGVVGSLMVLLKEAVKPNLVQTLEGTPALIHCGPFANIAHGCSSVISTKMGLKLADYCVTEAGFGTDLGAEKFFDIKCRTAGLSPAAAVIVASIRALKMHGGVPLAQVTEPNSDAMLKGCVNLRVHVQNIRKFGVPAVVAINRFPHDTEEEIAALVDYCADQNVPAAVSEVCAKGGEGGASLAEAVLKTIGERPAQFAALYNCQLPIRDKITRIAKEIYRAGDVVFAARAEHSLKRIENAGLSELPICMAKTQSSLTEDKSKLGAPTGWTLHIEDLLPRAGAGFIVAITGDIMLMPGLPKAPSAMKIDLLESGEIEGLF